MMQERLQRCAYLLYTFHTRHARTLLIDILTSTEGDLPWAEFNLTRFQRLIFHDMVYDPQGCEVLLQVKLLVGQQGFVA